MWRVAIYATCKSERNSSLGVVVAKNSVNLGDAFCSEVEGFNLLLGHANENFGRAGIGLLRDEGC